MRDQDHLNRINALTSNARNTWFALLGALVFVGITLMGVEHIDFYGVNRATKLPLVNVEVPTRYFFLAAPILIAAIYGYFHLYLIRLWDALGAAPSRLNGIRLGDAISPWLVTDAALHYRRRLRDDNSTTPRTLEDSAMILNILLAWGFGVTILGMLWMQSVPARDFGMTAIAAVAFLVSSIISVSSFVMMRRRMRFEPITATPVNWAKVPQVLGIGFGASAILWMSYLQTKGPIDWLARLDMSGQEIIERPENWLPYDIARKEFRLIWCRREFAGAQCNDLGSRETDFNEELKTRRKSLLADMNRPSWTKTGRKKPDLRQVILINSFLADADLTDAVMHGANLKGAQLEQADLSQARMHGAHFNKALLQQADLRNAELQDANFSGAKMLGVNLSGAHLTGADLTSAQMGRVVLSGANLENSKLRWAQMTDADLSDANLTGANFSGAQMERANLSGAQIKQTNLSEAQMAGSNLDFSQLTGIHSSNILSGTDLSKSTNNGGMLRSVDLSRTRIDENTDFRNAFLDGSVLISDSFRTQMGNPCQWVVSVLSDSAFYSHWRGWIEINPSKGLLDLWDFIAPKEFTKITATAPPEGCTWKAGPMPSATPN
ncbi:pentapeptide repeat-containing protein [uncultured Roseobacter sp.]|uniref:pentapeptide repeat-containing protein n=1 Tax=uncultured Roseobacter sp. TaxID=114847 RepID=UPI00260AF291|nr:pentapeptide repeat-containing protein [uncultured Roseobacter sp.]